MAFSFSFVANVKSQKSQPSPQNSEIVLRAEAVSTNDLGGQRSRTVKKDALLQGLGGNLAPPTSSNVFIQYLIKQEDAFGEYGTSVAIDGDTIAASAPAVNKVYVYKRSGSGWASTWSTQATITPPTTGGYFGYRIALDGDLLAIGDPNFTADGNQDQGSVFIYERSGTTWTLIETLTSPHNMTYDDRGQSQYFGLSVSINQNTLAVGAGGKDNYSGAAYVYVYGAGAWTLEERILGSGVINEQLGASVAVNGDNLLIGVPYRDSTSGASTFVDSGMVEYWNRSGGSWSHPLNIVINSNNALLGGSVAITTGGKALIGAPGWTNGIGAVCPVTTDSGTFVGGGCPYSPDYQGSANFGADVSISGTKAVVGEPGKMVGGNTRQGRIHTYDLSSGFTLVRSSSSNNGVAWDEFGTSVSIDGDTLVVGVPAYTAANHVTGQLGGSAWDGAIYVFQDYTTTAAGVVVSGRVRTSNGAGLKNAKVTLTDSQGTTRTASTGSFGSFRFENIPVGQDYVLTVGSKRYRFSPQTISLTADLTGLEITAGR
jgi:hypothetical protein